MKGLFVTLLPLLLSVIQVIAQDDGFVSTEFLDACMNGKMDGVTAGIKEHPTWLNGRSDSGETCLHVAGIYGQPEVSSFLLKNGADVNVRSSFEGGLRMHPLSWNVYAGHIDTVKVLVEEGKANVNLDFDDSKGEPITCLDVVLQILDTDDGESEDDYFIKFRQTKELLLKHGAKQYKDLDATEL